MIPLYLTLILSSSPIAPDFDTQVLPVLSRAGCNAGACHGAAIGRGGFKLSLWASDAAADYDAIVRELEGRRVNLTRPERSLLLAKPTGQLDHGGDVRLEEDGPGARIIAAWIGAGAARTQRRKLLDFDVDPQSLVVELNETVKLRAEAVFTDGGREDVTAWTVFTPNDAAAVQINDAGEAQILRRGQNIVVARYLDRVQAIELLTPLSAAPATYEGVQRKNFIDDHVLELLGTLQLPVSPPADDAAFLRRASLDLTGTLPQPADVTAFLADERADKRDRLIDRLLAADDFTDYWTWRWAALFQIDSKQMNAEGAAALTAWLRDQVASNAPWSETAVAILTAEGDSFSVGPANFTRATPTPRDQAELVSQTLMGVRLRCANCHNHPLDRWTQDDYHGLAAIFARLERGRVVRLGDRGDVTHPRTLRPAVSRLPGERDLSPDVDHRQELARWLTSGDNRYFARAIVNRLWHAMFGRGLVEPVDDLRDTNPGTHPALLDALAADFVSHGFELRHTLRLIASSGTYARSSQATAENAADDRFYSHFPTRPLPGAVLLDAWSSVTGVAGEFDGLPPRSRAIALVDARVPALSLDLLGRCPPGVACQGDAVSAGGLSKALHVINGDALNSQLASPAGDLARLLSVGRTDAELIDEFYLRALCRPPRADERMHWQKVLSAATGGSERLALWQDLLWGLLCSREFVTNH